MRQGRRRSLGRRVRRAVLAATGAFVLGSAFMVTLYGFVPPPLTPLMAIRLFQGEGLERDWVPLTRISPRLARAVVAAEDARFCAHYGIDWQAVRGAIERNRRGERTYGASTISMQTAKNLFLWPHRDLPRKILEAYFTLLEELFLTKARIMELYLNTVEWGPGIYGAEAAARYHFGKSALDLTRREAALLAAVLPNPRELSAGHPSGYVAERAQIIDARADDLPQPLPCLP